MRIQHSHEKNLAGKTSLWYFGFLIFFLGATASGCALSEQRLHPEFESKVKAVDQPVLLPPGISMLELLPSGMIRPREDWSRAGRQNLKNAILLYLAEKSCTLQPLVVNSITAQEIAEIQSLYRLVHKSMHQHAFHSHRSSQTGRRFDYSLGSIDGLLDNLGADSLIFVSGYDRVSGSGHKALIELAIADSSGTILYYSVRGTIRGGDLRDPASANAMVRDLLSGFSRITG